MSKETDVNETKRIPPYRSKGQARPKSVAITKN